MMQIVLLIGVMLLVGLVGGVSGGWLIKHTGPQGLFTACAAGMVVWLLVAWPMQAPSTKTAAPANAG